MPGPRDAAVEALAAVEQYGLILLQDKALPSLTTIVAGEPVSGSWWGHRDGHRIFGIAEQLSDHPDVAEFKLVDRKVCFVHRRLWPALVAIGTARAPWQLDGLDADATALLARVDAEGAVRASGKPTKQLERRLLAVGREVHTETGAHATVVAPWSDFVADRDIGAPPPVDEAIATVEAAVTSLADGTGANPRLPWGRPNPVVE